MLRSSPARSGLYPDIYPAHGQTRDTPDDATLTACT